MAVKASVMITITKDRDTNSITRYYLLQASTASKPAKPTTLTPPKISTAVSGWDDTEPTYTSGSTNTLYFVDRYIFTDGTFQYTEVSKSSSYEAAKEAYNKAQAAQNTANTTQENLNNLQIGGRNLLLKTNQGITKWSVSCNGGTITKTEDVENSIRGVKFTCTQAFTSWWFFSYSISDIYYKILSQKIYTISLEYKTNQSGAFSICIQNQNTSNAKHTLKAITLNGDENWHKDYITFKTNDVDLVSQILYMGNNTIMKTVDAYICIRNLKLEIGNKPTDWTPAPEDIDNAISKTVKQVDVEYYLSNKSDSCEGGSWSTTAPTWVDGKFMWSRQKITFVDNTTSTTNTTCIAGAKGSTGSTGTGINSITEEYYLSTSKTTQTGGSWVTNPPTWQTGKYIWTRSKIIYKNPTSTAYTTPVCSSEWEAVNELDIGGKNLLLDSKKETLNKTSYLVQRYTLSEDWIVGDEYTLSIKGNVESGQFGAWRDNGGRSITYNMNYNEEKNLWWYTFKCPEPWNETNPKNILSIYNTPDSTTHNSSIEWIKLEKGNKPTDWTPAPEDTDDAIEEVSTYAQNVANELLIAKGQLTAATTRIDSLQGIIENFVKDDNGMVTVTQTGSGMQIDMTQATNRINQLLTAIESAVTEGEANQLRSELLAAIQAVQSRTAYINATQDAQGRPVITLGATDSPFKVEITNEAINFIQNGQIIAYANGQKFYNLRTVVQQDVQIGIGPGFIWKTRDSGNMGLTWVPAQS